MAAVVATCRVTSRGRPWRMCAVKNTLNFGCDNVLSHAPPSGESTNLPSTTRRFWFDKSVDPYSAFEQFRNSTSEREGGSVRGTVVNISQNLHVSAIIIVVSCISRWELWVCWTRQLWRRCARQHTSKIIWIVWRTCPMIYREASLNSENWIRRHAVRFLWIVRFYQLFLRVQFPWFWRCRAFESWYRNDVP